MVLTVLIVLAVWILFLEPILTTSINIKVSKPAKVYEVGKIYCEEFTYRKLVHIPPSESVQFITLYDEFGKARVC